MRLRRQESVVTVARRVPSAISVNFGLSFMNPTQEAPDTILEIALMASGVQS